MKRRHLNRARKASARVLAVLFLAGAVSAAGVCYAAAPLHDINLGIILTTNEESHCFMFGGLGLSSEKTKETGFLTGIGYDLAFSDQYSPPWPKWEGVRIAAVYCHAGPEAAGKFIASMESPSSVVLCKTPAELFANCNCVFLVSTSANGPEKDELAPQCIAAGKPTFVDKYLASSAEQARKFIQMAEEGGVPLESSSLLWLGKPAKDLKAQLAGRKPTRVVSMGWSGENIAGDIHPIAHLISLAENRRPVSVYYDAAAKPKTIVSFDDGLVGELVPGTPDAPFSLQVDCEGKTLKVDYQNADSRPSAVNQLSYFFDYVRGKNKGVPAHVMEDSLALWDAAQKSKQTGDTVMLGAALGARPLNVGALEFRTPTVAVPFYHFALKINPPVKSPVYVHNLAVNGRLERNYLLVDKNEVMEPDKPRNKRRLTIAQALKSTRPEQSFEEPTLIGRADWRNGEACTIGVTISLGGKTGDTYSASAKGTAPQTGGYWDPAWKHYQSAVLSETAGLKRVGEPARVTILIYPDTLADPNREIRVVQYDWREKQHREVPSQVVDYDHFTGKEAPMYDEHGKQKPATFLPTDSVTVAFPADVEANSSSVYLIFYGTPDAPAPNYSTDLQVAGKAPGETVENSVYRLKLHDLSGMLDEVTLKSKPQNTFVHKKETNGAIQWNPDVYAPPRAWVHVSDWEPGKYDYEYEETKGPVVFRTRRWGQMPLMPEVTTSMEFEFYAGVPYFVMRSTMQVRYEVAVQALRNAEVVFAREAFSEVAWLDPERNRIETRHIISAPDLTEWTMADTTPWIAFFDREKGCGYGGIQMGYMNSSLSGKLRTLNPYIYVTTGPWIYWTRSLAYPYGSRNPQQLVNIPAGSVFVEEWGYLPFELGTTDKDRFEKLGSWQGRLAHPLDVHLEDPSDPRMEIPEEIYIEPAKTGWGEDAGYHKE